MPKDTSIFGGKKRKAMKSGSRGLLRRSSSILFALKTFFEVVVGEFFKDVPCSELRHGHPSVVSKVRLQHSAVTLRCEPMNVPIAGNSALTFEGMYGWIAAFGD